MPSLRLLDAGDLAGLLPLRGFHSTQTFSLIQRRLFQHTDFASMLTLDGLQRTTADRPGARPSDAGCWRWSRIRVPGW
ncbi:hypothetical protein G6F57_023387 [Rhizopus arrhizus]|nr:hypothetical protein G6F57_023387 [Rhizopus arrhizus]